MRTRRLDLSQNLTTALVILIVAVQVYPLLWMLASSFKPENDIFGSAALWPRSFSLDSYWRGWSGLRV